ncbi:unnamed protein product [Kuraishia capsulata CBS 1993]|uniref:Xylanolytic transcriptional activator regulatory domain-containing protein n=1 Tax=Kuraishia capsulata CBS 1993 TaxID=1382522 RepID=W6MMP5_9ASCO|nr:uncharacterized protein KUCA_T00002203001 [Kuraishia capsulata CBS 1993]CDK26232.1 unnamed protein product [Kuraishia capsulata CBS 1993]
MIQQVLIPKKRKFSNSPCTQCVISDLACDSQLPCGSCEARHVSCYWLPKMKRRKSVPASSPVAADSFSEAVNIKELKVEDILCHWQKKSSLENIPIPLPPIFSSPCCPAYLDTVTLSVTAKGPWSSLGPGIVAKGNTQQWDRALAKLLPKKSQCDLLIKHYMEEISWIYRTMHLASFCEEYEKFWASKVKDMDTAFIGLIFSMLAVISLFLPQDKISGEGYSVLELRKLSSLWYHGCRQAMIVSGFEMKPNLTHLHTFSVLQTYFYAINDSNTLHSLLGQAVVSAQILGLHDVKQPSDENYDRIDYEIRKRIWWDLCSCDTYQAFCMSRPPLIRCTSAVTPLPSNCHDSEITKCSIKVRPMSEPTYVSVTILIIQLMRICNHLWEENGVYTTDINRVIEVDKKMNQLLEQRPWYLQFLPDGSLPKLPEAENMHLVHWQFQNLYSCIMTQKLRMFRVYLSPRNQYAYNACEAAIHSVFDVYDQLRKIPNIEGTSTFLVQGYQTFSGAVALSAFLLVEQPHNADDVFEEVARLLEDMKIRKLSGVEHPVVTQGAKIIAKMMDILGKRKLVSDNATKQSLVGISNKIYTVFGGKVVAKSYVDRASKKRDVTPVAVGPAARVLREEEVESASNSPHTWAAFNEKGLLNNLDWSLWESFLLDEPAEDSRVKEEG